MSEGIDAVSSKGAWDRWALASMGVPPAEEYLQKQQADQQNEHFNARYKDHIGPAQLLSSARLDVAATKTGVDTNFVDTIAPCSPLFDFSKYSAQKQGEALQGAILAEPKLELKAVYSDKADLSVKGVTAAKDTKKSNNIFRRFIDWVAGLYGRGDDVESKSPAQRNAEALRDCMKKLNQALEKMRDLVQNNAVEGTNSDTELAALFLLLVGAVRRYDEQKKLDIADANKNMIEAQKAFKVAQQKYFDALNGTLWIPKVQKWVLKPLDVAATATLVASFGLMGAAVIAGFATGGIGAVVGAAAAVATYFVLMQAIGLITKGVVSAFRAVTQFETDRHTGKMVQARYEQEESSFTIDEEMRRTLECLSEVSRAWESMSRALSQQNSAITNVMQSQT